MQHDIMIINKGFLDINPLICGYEECEPMHKFGPAVRNYILLHYVLSGKGYFEKAGKTYTVEKGQIFVILPGETTTYTADEIFPWTYCWIGFECSIKLPLCFQKPVINGSGCEHIFRSISSKINLNSSKEYYLCGKIFEIIAILSESDELNENKAVGEYVLRAQNYMQNSYMENISVEKMARFLNIDRSYFCKIFKNEMGVSPQQYLINLRLEKSAELISIHNYKVCEAAQSCGYNDIVNFSRMFKRKFGTSPSRYSLKGK